MCRSLSPWFSRSDSHQFGFPHGSVWAPDFSRVAILPQLPGSEAPGTLPPTFYRDDHGCSPRHGGAKKNKSDETETRRRQDFAVVPMVRTVDGGDSKIWRSQKRLQKRPPLWTEREFKSCANFGNKKGQTTFLEEADWSRIQKSNTMVKASKEREGSAGRMWMRPGNLGVFKPNFCSRIPGPGIMGYSATWRIIPGIVNG